MSNLKNQEKLRDNIAGILELSRASWKLQQSAHSESATKDSSVYPRSLLFKMLNKHPLASTVTAASIWYLGPARFAAIAVAGISLFTKHRSVIIPIAQQLMTNNFFSHKKSQTESSATKDSAFTSRPIDEASSDGN
jgi:hypothetical protein